VTRDEATRTAVRYWSSKAKESLRAARDEAAAGRLDFAVNRCYYAAFYAASAVLLARGSRFAKHSGVRAAVHRDLVKTGLLSEEWGRFYDRLFQERQEADYIEFVEFEKGEVDDMIQATERFVRVLEPLMATPD
jgi:uncharacterized protein (UPF0332 family)